MPDALSRTVPSANVLPAVTARTAAGDIPIAGLPVDVQTSFPGINEFNDEITIPDSASRTFSVRAETLADARFTNSPPCTRKWRS